MTFIPHDEVWRADLADPLTQRADGAHLHGRGTVGRIPGRDDADMEVRRRHERLDGLREQLAAMHDEPRPFAALGRAREHLRGQDGLAAASGGLEQDSADAALERGAALRDEVGLVGAELEHVQ